MPQRPLVTDFIDLEKLQSVLRKLCTFVTLGCCVVTPDGRILIEEGWNCLCTTNRMGSTSTDFRQCIDIQRFSNGHHGTGLKKQVFTCRNGFSTIGAPIHIDGLAIASIFIGPFALEPDQDEPSSILSTPGQRQNGDPGISPPFFSPERIQRIINHLDIFLELIEEMGRNQLLEKKAAAALKKSEARYRNLVDSLPQIVFETDRQGRIVFFNKSAREILGTAEDMAGEDIDVTFFLPDNEHGRLVDRFNRILNGEILPSTECMFRRSNGDIFPVLLSCRPIEENGGGVRGIRGVLFDMSEHRQTELDLLESELRYRALFEKSLDALLLIEEEMIVDCNLKAAELFHTSRENLVGKAFPSLAASLTTQDDEIRKNLHSLLLNNEVEIKRMEWTFTPSNGVQVETTVEVNSVDLPGRSILQMILRDITEQNKEKRKLETRESAWKALFQHAPFGIAINRLADGVYLDINPALLKATGRSTSELLGRSSYDFLPEHQRSAAEKATKALLEQGFTGVQETDVLKPDGSTRSVLYGAATFKSGEQINVVSMVVDITERKEIERKLRQSEASMQSLYHTVPIGLAFLKDRVFLAANERLAEITGYSVEALLDHSSRCLYFCDEDFEAVGKALYLSPDSRGRGYIETRFRHRDGSTRYISLFAAPLEPDKPGEGAVVAVQDITEQKQMLQALQDSEERFRSIMEQSTFSMMILSPDGNVLHVNEAYLRLGGVGRELTATYNILTDPQLEKLGLMPVIRQAMNGEQVSLPTTTYDLSTTFGEGTQKVVQGDFYPARDANGAVRHIILIHQDVTDRKRAEDALQQSELRYRSLFEGAGDAIMLIKDGIFIDCNKKTLDMMQCAREEIIGRSPEDLAPPQQPDGQSSARKAQQLLLEAKQGKHLKFEWTICRPAGSSFYAEVSLRSIEMPGDLVVQAIVRDISERKKSEKSLRESEFRFRSFFNTNPEGILLLDFTGRILDANKSFLKKTGYTLAECKMVSFTSFVPESDHGKIRDALLDFKSGIAQNLPLQVSCRAKDERIIPVSLRGWLVVDEESTPLYLGVFIRDLTKEMQWAEDKKALEKQVIRAQKSEAIGTLASGIAHDFNNILGGVIGYTELALYRDPAVIDRKTKGYLERVLEGSNRAKSLVQQILRFSRSADTVMEPINLTPLIKETFRLLQSTLPKTITVEQNTTASSDRILGDSTQIHQVLMNLATNAYHAMREAGGVLSLKIRNTTLNSSKHFMSMTIPPGEYVQLTVGDTGCGMPPSVVERIFEPYFTTKRVNEGTGLGMAVVSGIVKSHNGLIDIQTTPGKGTTFEVFFPSYHGESSDKESFESGLPLGNGEKILIVDDEAYFLEVVHENLKMLGYQVDPYQRSLEALKTLHDRPHEYDLLITDQTMPEMTGVQLVEEVRKVNSTLPIILCTGFSEVVTEKSARYYGINHFLMKPVNIHDLAKTVAEALNNHE